MQYVKPTTGWNPLLCPANCWHKLWSVSRPRSAEWAPHLLKVLMPQIESLPILLTPECVRFLSLSFTPTCNSPQLNEKLFAVGWEFLLQINGLDYWRRENERGFLRRCGIITLCMFLTTEWGVIKRCASVCSHAKNVMFVSGGYGFLGFHIVFINAGCKRRLEGYNNFNILHV